MPIKPIVRKTDVPADGDVTMLEKDEKIFNTSGYEIHLVETLERDILQKNPDVRWRDVIGLDDAKSVLQEAMVLPLVMPDYFKVIRLCNVMNDVMYVRVSDVIKCRGLNAIDGLQMRIVLAVQTSEFVIRYLNTYLNSEMFCHTVISVCDIILSLCLWFFP